MSRTVLVLGNKNYSSWSLRAWLALRKAGAEFEERKLPLDTPRFEDEIADFSPTRRVPVLWDDALCIWDSLAICEYVNERWAEGSLLPAALADRARARSLCAEMHSGFDALRRQMPMNCRATQRHVEVDADLQSDLSRVISLWRECLDTARASGPWLFGDFSLADAMFAPVVLRFETYGVETPEVVSAYRRAVLADPDIIDWVTAGCAEDDVVEADEAGI